MNVPAAAVDAPIAAARPRTRGDCVDGPRPCPWRGCRHHLAREVRGPMTETCALDVADRGGATLEEVGAVLGVTRERIRQIEAKALRRAAEAIERAPRDASIDVPVKRARSGRKTATMTDEQCAKLRKLIEQIGPTAARRQVGNVAPLTIRKAAAGQPIARLTAEVIRGNLDRI